MSLTEWLSWIFSSGGNAVIVSWLFERFPWFQTLEAKAKEYVFFGAVFAMSLVAYLILNFVPKEILDAAAPYFGLLYTAFTGVFLGTAFHKVDKK